MKDRLDARYTKYNMPVLYTWPKVDYVDLVRSVVLSVIVFGCINIAAQVYASTVTLSIVVQTAITFQTTTDNFSTITPGTAVFATTTLQVTTNDANGWTVTLSGDNKTNVNNNLQRAGDTSVQIPDQTEWIPGAATTSAGNAVRISSFTNSGNVLAFRVMTASTSNGVAFVAPSWWGTADSYVDNANTLWAGIASSTNARQIGNAGAGSYSSGVHINSVNYYLNVGSSQKTGTYNAPITYTAAGN